MDLNVPLSPDRARRLARTVAGTAPAEVLDVGCGAGTLLLEVVGAAGSARGRGVDISRPAITRARARAHALGLADRVVFDVADAVTVHDRPDVTICGGSSHAVGGLDALLTRTRSPNLLLGEGFWHGTQPPRWRDAFGELPPGLEGLVGRARSAGWTVREAESVDPWEWDAFERRWNDAARRSALPGASALADERWEEYVNGYRGRLGFGWLWLRR